MKQLFITLFILMPTATVPMPKMPVVIWQMLVLISKKAKELGDIKAAKYYLEYCK